MFVGTLMKLPVKARDSGVIATRSEQWRTTQRPARDHCMAPGRTATPSGHRYTRMFPDLPHPDRAYLALVKELIPTGLKGLLLAGMAAGL